MQVFGPAHVHGAQPLNAPHTSRVSETPAPNGASPIQDELSISDAARAVDQVRPGPRHADGSRPADPRRLPRGLTRRRRSSMLPWGGCWMRSARPADVGRVFAALGPGQPVSRGAIPAVPRDPPEAAHPAAPADRRAGLQPPRPFRRRRADGAPTGRWPGGSSAARRSTALWASWSRRACCGRWPWTAATSTSTITAIPATTISTARSATS